MSSLEEIWTAGLLAVPSEAVEELPSPTVGDVDVDRVRGMLLGLAIGDSLGNRSESIYPADRRSLFGEFRDYVPHPFAGGRAVGLPSDDTQLAFWTVEHLLEHGSLTPEGLAEVFASREIFGLGGTVRAFREAMAAGVPWFEAGQPSAGNGAAMRIAPILLPHLSAPSPSLWRDAIVCGCITHNDPTSAGACVALVGLCWDLLHGVVPSNPEWWLDRYIELARPIEGEVRLRTRGREIDFEGPTWRFVDEVVRAALEDDVETVEACEYWGSGAFLLETIPSVLYIVSRHEASEEALIRAVNDTLDNDTVGAIVGALMGARHGASALPLRWREGLLGRTRSDDDGRVQMLTEEAVAKWLG